MSQTLLIPERATKDQIEHARRWLDTLSPTLRLMPGWLAVQVAEKPQPTFRVYGLQGLHPLSGSITGLGYWTEVHYDLSGAAYDEFFKRLRFENPMQSTLKLDEGSQLIWTAAVHTIEADYTLADSYPAIAQKVKDLLDGKDDREFEWALARSTRITAHIDVLRFI